MELGVRKTNDFSGEKRGWLRGPHGTGPGANPSVTLDYTLFSADLRPDGYIPSGTVVGEVGDSGVYGPYDPGATDGRETAAGLLFNSETVETADGKGVNALVRHGNVDASRLPFSEGPGAADEAAQDALHLIDWK